VPDRRPPPADANERLFRAAESGCISELQEALHAGAGPSGGYKYESSLFAAARSFHVEAVRTLLKAGADPNLPGISRVAPLWGALGHPSVCCPINRPRFRTDRLAILDALLAAGGNLNARADDGRTFLLYLMTMWNDRDFMEGLLARGADARVRDNHGDTALTLLIERVFVSALAKDERIRLLIAAGVDVNAKDSRGKSALDLVRDKARGSPIGEARDASSVMRMLIAAGAK